MATRPIHKKESAVIEPRRTAEGIEPESKGREFEENLQQIVAELFAPQSVRSVELVAMNEPKTNVPR